MHTYMHTPQNKIKIQIRNSTEIDVTVVSQQLNVLRASNKIVCLIILIDK